MKALRPKLEALAKASRTLADNLEAGTGPVLHAGKCWGDNGEPVCAVGHALALAGFKTQSAIISNKFAIEMFVGENLVLSGNAIDALDNLSIVNDDTPSASRNLAVVEPLRTWADALEEQAKQSLLRRVLSIAKGK